MKKVFFAIMAVLAIACTGCKTDNASVTVTIKDKANNPIKDRAVFYTDKASLIAEAVLPPTQRHSSDWMTATGLILKQTARVPLPLTCR